MSYAHIENLYANQEILLFKRAFALEKIHGSSAHISKKNEQIRFFAGGESHVNFVKLFDEEMLKEKLDGISEVVIYGEVYGGKCQGMSKTYGKDMKFVVFDVKFGDSFVSVPQAEQFAKDLGLEFVHYVEINTTMEEIDREMNADSVQAIRNGMGEGHRREGVVLRPLIEVRKNNGERICSKHKHPDFRETKTPREVSPEQLKILEDARAIAEEWVTPMRVSHVLDKIDNPRMEKMNEIIIAMTEDVKRESAKEIVWSKEVEREIGKATGGMVRKYFQDKLYNKEGE